MTANLFFLLVSPHTTPTHNQPRVTFEEGEEEKKSRQDKRGNTLTIPVAPESMFESWCFTFSTCYEAASNKNPPLGPAGGHHAEHRSEGQKHSSHKAAAWLWLEKCADLQQPSFGEKAFLLNTLWSRS